MKSDEIKIGVDRSPNRSLLFALGLTEEELQRPIIGVVSCMSNISPGLGSAPTTSRMMVSTASRPSKRPSSQYSSATPS